MIRVFRHVLSHTKELSVYDLKSIAVHHLVHLALHFLRAPVGHLKWLAKREEQQTISVGFQAAELNYSNLIAILPQLIYASSFPIRLNERDKRNRMPLRKTLKKIIRPDLIASVWRIREPQTEKKNLHVRVYKAILIIAPLERV